MLQYLLFNALYVGACGFAFLRGGMPERLTAAMFVLSFQLSTVVVSPLSMRYRHLELGILLVDLALFAGLYLLGCLSTRFWTLWMAGLQGAVLFSHFASLAPRVIAWTASWAVAAWYYPMLVLLVVATVRHRRRLARQGFDPAWSWELPASYRAGGPADERPDRDQAGGRAGAAC